MNYRFARGETHYTLDGKEKRIPAHWNLFGLPIHHYKGQDGFMGKTRVWLVDGERKMKQTLFWPLRTLHEAGL